LNIILIKGGKIWKIFSNKYDQIYLIIFLLIVNKLKEEK
tara:strand:+ start:74174 stop:74290 length:117 start_codon:yes stop_codon:yes gene_type:complete